MMDEEKRRVALAKMEEEERAKAQAFEAEEARKLAISNAAKEANSSISQGIAGEELRPNASAVNGSEKPDNKASSGSGEEVPIFKPSKGSGEDEMIAAKADPNKRTEKGIEKATGIKGEEEKPSETLKPPPAPKQIVPPDENYEVLPDVSVEEIVETNRTITKVTVRKNQKETIFSKVIYKWGGIYYFRQNMSISESLYASSTGLK
ncbi:MAG: hypothetical protein IPP71_21605 [Bacteroidetes bacterium]|nr:hypothetical protein [Bacteroidota bacterium]